MKDSWRPFLKCFEALQGGIKNLNLFFVLKNFFYKSVGMNE